MPSTEVASSVPPPEGGTDRIPLSGQQELWCAGAESGAFGPRFIVTKALRITGPVDVAALRGALDDVVARHEVLRTVVVRDAEPPYQEVHPPAPVPLQVRDLPADGPEERDRIARELLTEVESSSLPVTELPLLRAVLGRFDERDWVLGLASHHTACDGWSLQLVTRDLAACYAARIEGRAADLPATRQYREYTRWQADAVSGAALERNLAFWRERLDGAPFFTLPTDRPVPPVHTRPYLARNFVIDAGVMAEVSGLARQTRSSRFMVMLAAFTVLAHRIGGSDDPVVNTIVHGRGRAEFHDTVGPFLNFLPLRTDLGGCESFREVLARTRTACLEAYTHEVPVQYVEEAVPSLMAPMADPRNCDFIFGFAESLQSFAGGGPAQDPFRISEASVGVRKAESVSEQIPGGAAWNMGVNSTGEVSGALQYNPEEFDDRTAAEWVAEYVRIVTNAAGDPDRAWKTL